MASQASAATDSFGQNFARRKSDIVDGVCPHCGQRIHVMFGEKFELKKWLILSAIKDATEGRGGIEGKALESAFYGYMPHEKAIRNIRVQINQINDELASTDWRIINTNKNKTRGLSFYKLVESK